MALRRMTPDASGARRVARAGAVVAAVATIAGSGALAQPLADSVSITSGPSGETTATSATFTFTGTGAVTAFRCQLDNARTATPCSSPTTLSRLALGRHTFVVHGYRGDLAVGVSDRRTWTVVAPSAPPPPPPTTPSPTPEPPPPGELPPLARAIVGTEGDDVIEGTPGDDVIFGLGGDDAIEGREGNDTIIGGSGRDRIDGGPGDDRIVGGHGRDEIWGDAGDDAIFVVDELPDTSILGGAGRDRVWRDRADPRNRVSGEVVRLVLGGAVAFSDKSAIWTMDVNGTSRKRLTLKKVVPGTVDADPKWSPDGTRIAFQRTTNATENQWRSDIWVVNWDGSGLTNVTASPAYREQSPAWSPDGSRIAFYVEESSGSDEWLAHRALAPGSPLWSVTGRNDFEDVEWRADGTYLYGGTCTGATGYLVRAAPWTTSAPTGFANIPGAAVTDPGDAWCDSELSTAPSDPFTLLFARQQRGFPSGTGTSVIRRKVDGSPTASPGEPVVVPPITFGGTDNGGTMPDWNAAGTGFVFVAAGAVWRAAANGFPRKTLGRGSQPDWR